MAEAKKQYQITLKVAHVLGSEFNELPEEIKLEWRKKARRDMARLCHTHFHIDYGRYGLEEGDDE